MLLVVYMGIISLCGSFMALQFEAHQDGYLYRANGRGPALPGLRYRIAPRQSALGRCEWPETTTLIPAPSGSIGMVTTSCNT